MHIAQRPESEQQAFFEAMHEKALAAEAATAVVAHLLDVAGIRIRLVFAGPRLEEELMPALQHLRVVDADIGAGDADAVFHIWDSRSTGVATVPPPCGRVHFTDRGDVWGFGGERWRVAFHWVECSVNAFDRRTGCGVWWVDDAAALPYWTTASPLRSLFHWTMELHGRQLLHAAAIGDANGAVLITGKGGVGKSTTALSALVRGMRYVGDDYLVVGLDPEPTVFSLYGTAKLNPEQMVRFPALAPHVANRRFLGEQKAVLRLHPAFSAQLAASMPLRAVLTPRFGDADATRFVPAAPLQLARAASFTTMCQLPYAGRATNRFVEHLVERVPGFEIVLGQDLDGVVAALRRLLATPPRELEAEAAPRPAPAGRDAPFVSVVIPVCNGAPFLRDAVESIVAQRHPRLEIVVVDDGSTDDLEGAVAALPVEVRLFRQRNAGAAAARNRGVRESAGDLIAFLDVDDLWPDRNLANLLAALRDHPEVDVVHGYGQLMAQDAQTGRYEYVGNPGEAFGWYIGAGLYRREAFERTGLFDPELRFGEDTDWFNRAREGGVGLLRIDAVTLLVRRHERNMTNGKSPLELNALRVLKKQLDRRRRVERIGHRLAAIAASRQEGADEARTTRDPDPRPTPEWRP